MFKKIVASSALAASVLGLGVALAPQAMAVNNDETNAVTGNGATEVYGNAATHGNYSPQMSLIQGSLNNPCVGVPLRNVGGIAGLVGVQVPDILTSSQYQTCVENSSQTDGDDPLSDVLSEIALLAGNGTDN
ncbi:rodlin [Streptomyces sp. NRRL F-2664]|uniref:rodlin n=1 Tax=Streptomyces sp. NRRL F-2664 TaxID=1463842 RepID=UPI0004CC0952|nr:rodlin [Streptomyces sp. NRRL F-2664]